MPTGVYEHKLGEEAPNYKTGNYCKDKIFYCINCEKEIDIGTFLRGSKRCRSCSNRLKEKPKNYCIDCLSKGIKTEITFYAKRCYKCYWETKKGKGNNFYGKPAPHSKWIKYKNIWMRSSWEVAFARWLDKNNIKWLYEPKYFEIIIKGKDTTYTPDFYLPKTNEYIEIKGWWHPDTKKKFELFRKLYPSINIKVLMKPELQELGLNV